MYNSHFNLFDLFDDLIDDLSDIEISKPLVIFIILLILFLACSYFQQIYNPIQDIIEMDAPSTEGITMLHMDNPIMRYVASEETAKAHLMVAAVGVGRRYGYGGVIYLFTFVLFSSLWSLVGERFFLMRNYTGVVNRTLIAVSHYFASFVMMYLLTLLTYFISRFIAIASNGEMGILLVVVALILYIVFLILSLPFYFAWFLDWLGEGLFIWLMFYIAGRISSEAAIFGADTVKKMIENPKAIIIFALILLFDRLWAEYVKPFLYSGVLEIIIEKVNKS